MSSKTKIEPKCPKGKILREGYERKEYVKKSGSRVPATKVPSACVKDQGKPGKTPIEQRVIPKLVKGEVSQFGYSTKDAKMKRQKALVKAVKELGKSAIQKHMVAVRTLSKNKADFDILDEDVKFLQAKFYPERLAAKKDVKKPKKPTKAW